MPLIGAHVAGGVKGAVGRAQEIRAEALQIFVGSPQMWRASNPSQDEIVKFRSDLAAAGLGPVFVHAIYLINLAAERPDIYERSIASLVNQLNCADRLGAEGVIFHPGSAGSGPYEPAFERLVRAIEQILNKAEGQTRLVLEVCAGQRQTIGSRFEQLAEIIDALGGHDRLAVCWDTCHLYNAGYDIASPEGLQRTLEEMDRVLGLDRLVAVHANDSKHPLGAGRDRHENIGRGHIGEEAFARLLAEPALQSVPFLLEVPGFDGKGPDLENIKILRQLAGRPLEAAIA